LSRASRRKKLKHGLNGTGGLIDLRCWVAYGRGVTCAIALPVVMLIAGRLHWQRRDATSQHPLQHFQLGNVSVLEYEQHDARTHSLQDQ
jgi:hypothetical protein